jgi:hypothetical protein
MDPELPTEELLRLVYRHLHERDALTVVEDEAGQAAPEGAAAGEMPGPDPALRNWRQLAELREAELRTAREQVCVWLLFGVGEVQPGRHLGDCA